MESSDIIYDLSTFTAEYHPDKVSLLNYPQSLRAVKLQGRSLVECGLNTKKGTGLVWSGCIRIKQFLKLNFRKVGSIFAELPMGFNMGKLKLSQISYPVVHCENRS